MPAPNVTWVGMTRRHFTPGPRPGPIRLLVLHATAGTGPGDLAWLRTGGSPLRPVSAHYYIDKVGRIAQLVRDEDMAWHTGASSWTVDGARVSGSVNVNGGTIAALNAISVGIELENRNDGRDLYPPAQIRAAEALARAIVGRYNIPREQLVRHLDIAPGRKTDPAGFPWETFVRRVYAAQAAAYDEYSPIMAAPEVDALALADAFADVCAGSPYAAERLNRGDAHSDPLRRTIVPRYVNLCSASGVDPLIALAQVIHETDRLQAALALRPVRNPAGIGVTGRTVDGPPPAEGQSILDGPEPGYIWDADRGAWRAAVAFPSWDVAAAAHIGRLIAYGTEPRGRTRVQHGLVDVAMGWRPLPAACHGSAVTIRALGYEHNPCSEAGCGWAKPGREYGRSLAGWANALRRRM